MQQTQNPWITSPAAGDASDNVAAEVHLPPTAKIDAPLLGIVEPDWADRLGRRTVSGTASLWVTGVHGGAGESRLASLLDGARATDHAWPVHDDAYGKLPVLLACRSDMRGLQAARSALIQWASGAAPAVELLGLAVLADAPGKLPKPLREFAALVGGGAPRLWMLPWVESWRLGDSTASQPGHDYQRFATDLAALTN
ncbi:DUF6668 family protein [Arthrobacter sp. ISL-72]|uniref:DUF6668 family protein n=1 Tax=Arthrobacter sp. ISL-72 TaxID=2819114 RepID=UPI001BEB7190|nr:DUF6668 family protein [Arthrobacter sp. ISL-72]MBT2594052.1 hypothetical protein [Arthrobacter sp. ISL-72]